MKTVAVTKARYETLRELGVSNSDPMRVYKLTRMVEEANRKIREEQAKTAAILKEYGIER